VTTTEPWTAPRTTTDRHGDTWTFDGVYLTRHGDYPVQLALNEAYRAYGPFDPSLIYPPLCANCGAPFQITTAAETRAATADPASPEAARQPAQSAATVSADPGVGDSTSGSGTEALSGSGGVSDAAVRAFGIASWNCHQGAEDCCTRAGLEAALPHLLNGIYWKLREHASALRNTTVHRRALERWEASDRRDERAGRKVAWLEANCRGIETAADLVAELANIDAVRVAEGPEGATP